METSRTTTTDPDQLPVSLSHIPTLADRMLAFLRWILFAIQTIGQLIGENEQEHPTSEFESPDRQNEQPVMMTILSIQHSEDQSIDLRLTENVVPDIENQIESTAISMENPENDSSNHPPIAAPIATTPHAALLHDYLNPKIATYFVGVYPTFLTFAGFKFIAEKHSPFDTHKSLMIISITAYLMAILDLKILFCLYDGLKRPSNQHVSPGHYKIITNVYYILWILAIMLFVPALIFTPQS